MCDAQPMTIVDVTKVKRTHPNLKSIQADIRAVEVKDIGLFENIILMSTLEHISTPFHSPGKKPSWKEDPISEQLEVFRACMRFLAPGGHMIFTVPCGVPLDHTTDKCFSKIHYDNRMLSAIKEGFEVVDEVYYKRPDIEWIKCDELPNDGFFNLLEEVDMQVNNHGTRGLVLMVLSK